MQGDYTITDKVLGKGSFGEVRIGIEKATGKQLAIKLLDRTKTDLDALVREISIIQSCDHENIIKFYGYFEDDTYIYIVTELANGGELFDHIVKRKRYSEEDARAIVKQIVAALCYLHSNKVAHLDLKPENLLLKEVPSQYDVEMAQKFTPCVKLADFGTSVMFSEEQKDQKILAGTPGYVAPEVLLKKQFTTEPDIYAVGVITYVMLSGCLPFNNPDIKQLLRSQIKGEWSFNSRFDSVSENARDFIKQCMNLDFQARPTAVQLLKHKWMQQISMNTELIDSQKNLKRYLAKLKLKAGFIAVIAAMRMTKIDEILADD